jgi:hypothetical protein
MGALGGIPDALSEFSAFIALCSDCSGHCLGCSPARIRSLECIGRMHPFPAGRLCRHALVLSLLTVLLAGCGPVYNNTLQVNTAVGKVTTGGTVLSPLGSQPVAGQWTADIPLTSTANTEGVAPSEPSTDLAV